MSFIIKQCHCVIRWITKFCIVYYESQWYPPSAHNNNFYQIYSETLKMPNFHYLLTDPRISMDTCFYVIAWTPRPLEFFRFRYVPLKMRSFVEFKKWSKITHIKVMYHHVASSDRHQPILCTFTHDNLVTNSNHPFVHIHPTTYGLWMPMSYHEVCKWLWIKVTPKWILKIYCAILWTWPHHLIFMVKSFHLIIVLIWLNNTPSVVGQKKAVSLRVMLKIYNIYDLCSFIRLTKQLIWQ